MKKIYDNKKYTLLKNDIVEIFVMKFNYINDAMEQIVEQSSNIEEDNQLKQFRIEMLYMKKILKCLI